ncbi:MAG TPA: cation:proton antiporter, partial [Vampirovibrionales bacterium]
MAESLTLVNSLTPTLFSSFLDHTLPLLATAGTEVAPAAHSVKVDEAIVVAGVLLSLVVIYLASKIGGEICSRINLPPVLGDLVGGVIIGVSVLKLIVFPEGGEDASSSVIMNLLQNTTSLEPEALVATFAAQSEVIAILAELGVIILLFEIGLESEL